VNTFERQWESINDAEANEKRAEFMKYCLLCVAAVENGSLTPGEAAYKICGTGGQIAERLRGIDQAIIDIACDLELPPGQRAHPELDWGHLVAAIRQAEMDGG